MTPSAPAPSGDPADSSDLRVDRVGAGMPVAAGVDVAEVVTLTRRAFAEQSALVPRSRALTEEPATVAAEVAEHGGVVVRDRTGRLLGACRLRRRGLSWEIRRCAVDPGARQRGVGRAVVAAVEQWAVEEGAVRTHVAVRTALPGNRRFWTRLGFTALTSQGAFIELVHPLALVLVGPEATQGLGRRLAAELRAGDLVVLSGPLGAGKTALTQGIGAGLGVLGPVTSPTFVLARVHRGTVPLVHVDAYRLQDGGGRLELDDLDLDASLADSVTVVEWGEGLVEGLADSRLEVFLDRQDDELSRIARVVAHGERWSVLRNGGGSTG